jgi:hypothetical protein
MPEPLVLTRLFGIYLAERVTAVVCNQILRQSWLDALLSDLQEFVNLLEDH